MKSCSGYGRFNLDVVNWIYDKRDINVEKEAEKRITLQRDRRDLKYESSIKFFQAEE